MTAQVLCIGSALWDVIGHSDRPMEIGFDRPGQISRHPGGVALNVAYALLAADVRPVMLTAIGTDAEGDALVEAMSTQGVDCEHIVRVAGRTDIYMAIEHNGTLFGAVADCASLEAAGTDLFGPLKNGAFNNGSNFDGIAVIDGNLPVPVLEHAIDSGILSDATVLFVPASPGKAARMTAILKAADVTLCVNRIEAEIICGRPLTTSRDAALALAALGCSAIVTDSARPATLVIKDEVLTTTPPDVNVLRVTGAGDAFLAGYIAGLLTHMTPSESLHNAAKTAAQHISEPGL